MTVRALVALAVAAAAASITGCGAIEKLEEKQLEADRRECSNYGFAPATDAFAGCMQRIQSERQRRWAEQERARQAAEAQKNQPPQAMDCKTSETVSSSSDGTSTTTKSRTTCVGM